MSFIICWITLKWICILKLSIKLIKQKAVVHYKTDGEKCWHAWVFGVNFSLMHKEKLTWILLCTRNAVSCYSLFPLLYEAQEYPIKVLLLLLHTILMWFSFSAQYSGSLRGDKKGGEKQGFEVGWVTKSYLIGVVVVEIWGQFLHPHLFGDKLPFVPLMLISMFCAIGILYSWIWQLKSILISFWLHFLLSLHYFSIFHSKYIHRQEHCWTG